MVTEGGKEEGDGEREDEDVGRRRKKMEKKKG